MRNLTADAVFAMAAMCDLQPSDITEADRELVSDLVRGLYSGPRGRAIVEAAAVAVRDAEGKEPRRWAS